MNYEAHPVIFPAIMQFFVVIDFALYIVVVQFYTINCMVVIIARMHTGNVYKVYIIEFR
jgi:hypothetical protein